MKLVIVNKYKMYILHGQKCSFFFFINFVYFYPGGLVESKYYRNEQKESSGLDTRTRA